MQNKIEISAVKSYTYAWEKFKANWQNFTLIILLTVAMSYLLSFLSGQVIGGYVIKEGQDFLEFIKSIPSGVVAGYVAVQVLNVLISVFLTYNLYKGILKMIDGGAAPDVNSLFESADNHFWAYVGVGLLVGILYILMFIVVLAGGIATLGFGFLIFIPLYIYLVLRISFASLLIVDKKTSNVFSAMSKSWRLTSGKVLSMIGFIVLTIVLVISAVIVGLLALLAGVIPAGIIVSSVSQIAYLHFYRSFLEAEHAIA